jgi:hypothetical protein
MVDGRAVGDERRMNGRAEGLATSRLDSADFPAWNDVSRDFSVGGTIFFGWSPDRLVSPASA